MNKFAKLYETEDIGQILVMLDQGDDGPEVKIYFTPEGLGVCAVSNKFKDTDSGWDAAEAFFDKIEERDAITLVEHVFNQLSE